MTSTQRRVDRAVKVGISQATSRVQGAAADAADEGASGQSVTNHAFAKGSCEDATSFAAEGMFEVIGFDAAEERAYVTLLQHPGLTAAQLARHLTVSNWHAEGLVRELEAKGMVSRVGVSDALQASLAGRRGRCLDRGTRIQALPGSLGGGAVARAGEPGHESPSVWQ